MKGHGGQKDLGREEKHNDLYENCLQEQFFGNHKNVFSVGKEVQVKMSSQ